MNRPTRRDPRIAFELEQRTAAVVVLGPQRGEALLGVDDHRAELEDLELDAVSTDPPLAEQHRAAIGQRDGGGDHQHQRGQHDEHHDGHRDVEGALAGELHPRQVRRLDVEQRLVGDRQCPDPAEVDAGQTRIDVEVTVTVALVAHERVEQVRADVARAQHDAVDVDPGQHVGRRRVSGRATGRPARPPGPRVPSRRDRRPRSRPRDGSRTGRPAAWPVDRCRRSAPDGGTARPPAASRATSGTWNARPTSASQAAAHATAISSTWKYSLNARSRTIVPRAMSTTARVIRSSSIIRTLFRRLSQRFWLRMAMRPQIVTTVAWNASSRNEPGPDSAMHSRTR